MPGTTVTVGDVIRDVITELSQVPGIATQIYASDRIRKFIEDAMQMELDEMWWPNLMWYQKIPLDGVNGLLTEDIQGPISFIDKYEDIASVWPEGSDQKIAELPQSINPFNLSGSMRAQFISPDFTFPHRPFRVWPANSTGSVVIWGRQSCTFPMSDNDEIYLDRTLIQYDACWMYAVDDGTVPAQVNKFQMLAQKRRNQMKSNFTQHGLMLDPRLPTGTLQNDFSSNTFIVGGTSVMLP